MSQTEAYIYKGLMARGVPSHVASGLILNMKDESGLRADIVEGEANVHGTYGKGLIQLTDDRRVKFEEKYGTDWSIDNQLDHIVGEFEGPESRAYQKAVATKTSGDAGASLVHNFLRPAKEHADRRAAKYTGQTYVPPESDGTVPEGATSEGVPAEPATIGDNIVGAVMNSIMPKARPTSSVPHIPARAMAPPPMRRSQRKPPVVLVARKEKKK